MSARTDTLLQDISFAWRGLHRRGPVPVISALMLALGIGVTAAVFSLFYAVLMHPLPHAKPEQLGVIWATFRAAGTARAPVSGTILREIQSRNRSFSGVAGIWTITRTLVDQNPEQVKAARVTANFFDVMGVRAQYGHTFNKEDDGGTAVVLTDGLFLRRFNADRTLLGRGLPIGGKDGTLIGVLAPDFQLHFAPEANIPADVQLFETFWPGVLEGRKEYFLRVVSRLRPGVSLSDGQRDLDRVAAEIRDTYSDYAGENLSFTLTSMQADSVRDVKPALTALFAGALFVLLICCVNVAGLLVAKASDRRKEMALRLALGASRTRIIIQLLIEGGMLCLVSGIMGVAVGWVGFRALLSIRPERLAYIDQTGLNWAVLAFAAGTSLAATLFFGLIPALESLRTDLVITLRASGRSSAGPLRRRTGAALIVGDVALAFVLVTCAALTSRTLSKLTLVHPGFEPRNVLAFQVAGASMPSSAVSEWESRLASLPAVERVGATSHLPLDNDIPNWYGAFYPEGTATANEGTLISDLRCITPGYFAAMGVRLLEGRYFTSQDGGSSQQVVIVDDLLARSTWPGQSALGKVVRAEHLTQKGFQSIPSVVVGVVEHVHNHSLARQVRGQIYLPFEQSPRSPLTYALRTKAPPLSLVPDIRRILLDRNKSAAMAKVRPLTEYVARDIAPFGFTAVLAGTFAIMALLLAVTGLYGVLNYQVSQRMPEMGIRIALGASVRQVMRLVIREGLVLVAAGLLIGAAATYWMSRLLAASLYGVSPFDLISYVLAALLLPAAALLGCWLPAKRAGRANPSEIIRSE